jgi:SMODS domain-containing protein
MGIQTHFDKFHTAIKLSREDTAYKKARERDDSITKAIKTAFKDAGYAIIEDFIQGSHKMFLAVVPIDGDHDVDRALVIASDTAPDNPVDPKSKVLEVLEARGFTNAKIKKPCVTADYVSENVHIDFPIYKLQGGQYYLAVGKKNSDENNREWSLSAPHELIDWVNDDSTYFYDKTKELAQFRRLTRYTKRWRDVQFTSAVAKKVYSIGLTVMIKQKFQASFSTEGISQDLQALHQTVTSILSGGYLVEEEPGRWRIRVDLPKAPWRNIFDGSSLETGTQLYNKLTNLKNKLADAIAKEDEVEQCKILNKLFGDDFVVPEVKKDDTNSGNRSQRRVYASAGTVRHSDGA